MCTHANNIVLVEEEVEELLTLPENTMAHWRIHGYGPVYIQLTPDEFRYFRSDIDLFLNMNRKNAKGQLIAPWQPVNAIRA